MRRALINLLFKRGSTGQLVVQNAIWLFLGEVFGRLIRFSIVIYSARILGAAEYGVFSYALTLSAMLTLLSDIGISAFITRETSRFPDRRSQYIGTAITLKAVLILLNGGLLIAVVPLFISIAGTAPLLPLVLLVFAFDSMRELGFGINRALEQMRREAAIKVLMNIAIALLGFLAIALEPSARSLMISYAIGSGIGCLGTAYILREYLRIDILRPRGRDLWAMFIASWPVGMLGILGAIMINTDMLMLGWWVSPLELGYYAAAQKIILLLYVAPTLFASAVFPALSRLAGMDDYAARLLFERSLRGVMLIALPLALCGVVLAPEIISLLFGQAYLPATGAFRVLLCTIIFVFPSSLFSNALFAYNRQKSFLWLLALGAVSNALLNWLLIPHYSIVGASFATIGSQLLTNLLIWILLYRLVRFDWRTGLARSILVSMGAAAMACGLAAIHLPVLLVIITVVLLYLLVLYLCNEPLLQGAGRLFTRERS